MSMYIRNNPFRPYGDDGIPDYLPQDNLTGDDTIGIPSYLPQDNLTDDNGNVTGSSAAGPSTSALLSTGIQAAGTVAKLLSSSSSSSSPSTSALPTMAAASPAGGGLAAVGGVGALALAAGAYFLFFRKS